MYQIESIELPIKQLEMVYYVIKLDTINTRFVWEKLTVIKQV